MRDVVIFGGGQIAEVVYYYLTEEGGRKVAAFTVDGAFRTADSLLGTPVVDFANVEELYPPSQYDMFVAMSFKKVNKLRQAKVEEAMAKGYSLASHVSPRATVWTGFELQPNTIIMEENVVQPFARIGRNCIVWSGNHIGHHSTVEDNCFIASHAVISGSVTIGRGSFVGVNATIRDNVKIGSHNVLGAGTLILSDTPDDGVFMGEATAMSRVPSHRLRSI